MDIENLIGLGVAGNFAGHLEQAGEAEDFKHVTIEEENQPKALFPFYIPSPKAGFLNTFPLSSTQISAPAEGGNRQIEPEVAILCELIYENNQVTNITPKKFGAYNDCSIRKPGASKISEKKNWGEHSKGFSEILFEIDAFKAGGIMDRFRIACFLKRDNEFYTYGIDSCIADYSYFHQKLLNWIKDRMNNQPDQGPMEHIATHLKNAGYPPYALISVGATRYTDYGETHYLQAGDTSIVVIYDGEKYTPEEMESKIKSNDLKGEGISALIQEVD